MRLDYYRVACTACGTDIRLAPSDKWGGMCGSCIERLNLPSSLSECRIELIHYVAPNGVKRFALSDPVSPDAFAAWHMFRRNEVEVTAETLSNGHTYLCLDHHFGDFRSEIVLPKKYMFNGEMHHRESISEKLESLLLSSSEKELYEWIREQERDTY